MATIQVKDATGATQTVPVLPSNDGTALPVVAAALPLPSGAATSAKQDALLTALGTPLQAGGAITISNSPTVNLGTIGLAATDAKSEAIRALLAGTLTVTGPLTGAQLTSAALATSAKQDTGNTSLATLVTQTTGLATAANQTSGTTSIVGAINGATYYPATQPVSATALPLPAGAATDTSVKLSTSADDVGAITPSDTTALTTIPKALYVSVAGTLAVKGTSGLSVSLGSVSVGQVIPVRARYVMATGTTATVVGLY